MTTLYAIVIVMIHITINSVTLKYSL